MNLCSIPEHLPFLDLLAAGWRECRPSRDGNAVTGIILLPTRRAARALAAAFLRQDDGRPALLPRIVALGALDETPLALAGSLDLLPAVEPMRRLAELSRLVLAASGALGVPQAADQAWRLARSLAGLMDEAERSEADLAERLPRLAEAHAEHWQITLDFLRIVTAAWPEWLRDNRLMNPAARQAALLRAQAELWRQDTSEPVWAAGFGVASAALSELLGVVARRDGGLVVLQGLDRSLDETAWAALPPTHPQSAMARLLAAIGAHRDQVGGFPGMDAPVDVPSAVPSAVPRARAVALRMALLPEQALGAWIRDTGPAELGRLSRIAPADQQEEAAAISLLMRDAIETPGRRAALITPDRGLAARVAVELGRFGVVVDDSAGEPLAATPPAVLLRLLARCCTERLSPVGLLSLLKHPLAAAGHNTAECRRLARGLETTCLRGPAPSPGLGGLRRALVNAAEDARRPARPEMVSQLQRFLDILDAVLLPLTRLCESPHATPVAELLEGLIQAAEALAGTDREAGSELLWAGEDGNALARHLESLLLHATALPPQPASMLPGLLDASLEGIAIRSRRALRGRQEREEQPRLVIWGLLEARLQSVEFAVLGGLVEGVWPAAADPGPWMSRPMRAEAGLPSPEEAIGEAARDFLAAACAAGEVVLSHPARRDGAPAVPARWLVRLEAWLRGRGAQLAPHPVLSWLRALDQPRGAVLPVPPPAPRPPLALRPRRLSVTEIETWMRDPYAIHARHVLRLRPLAALEEAADAADYGTIVHDALQAFLLRHGAEWPADAAHALEQAFLAALDGAALRPALSAWWRPRLLRIARWVAATEASRREGRPPLALATEISGQVAMRDLPGGDFVLRGRADRIERYADGRLALLDYKTGSLPTVGNVREGWSSQLVLEAAMARIGGFGEAFCGEASSLAYWQLSGGHEPGKLLEPVDAAALPELVDRCWESLRALIAAYDDPEQAYLSQPRPDAAPRFSDYAALARVAEWSAAREEGE